MSRWQQFASYHLVMLGSMQYRNCDHLHAIQAMWADTNGWKSFVIQDFEVVYVEAILLSTLEHYQL